MQIDTPTSDTNCIFEIVPVLRGAFQYDAKVRSIGQLKKGAIDVEEQRTLQEQVAGTPIRCMMYHLSISSMACPLISCSLLIRVCVVYFNPGGTDRQIMNDR